MVRIAGGIDTLGVAGGPSRYASWADVAGSRPDLLVLMPCGFGLDRSRALVPTMTSRPGFDDLPCAADGGVVAVDGSAYFNRPGPRITRGLEILAGALRAHPGIRET
jgi:iron complex transport system substrate-binding protein